MWLVGCHELGENGDLLARNFENDIANEEYHQRDGVLVRGKSQICLHAGNLCVSNTKPMSASIRTIRTIKRRTLFGPCRTAST